MTLDISSIIEGFMIGASLIMAIGAQNAFLLRQGLRRQHLLLCAITCSISDALLIVLGITGIGELISDFPVVGTIMRWGGALFLICYGIRSFRNVFHPHIMVAALESGKQETWLATFLMLLGFTFLNPHVYIDTLLLLGTIGGERPPEEHLSFMIGAVSASFTWFFSLTYGASKLTPFFKNPRSWQVLDTIMGFIMIGIAISLLIPG